MFTMDLATEMAGKNVVFVLLLVVLPPLFLIFRHFRKLKTSPPLPPGPSTWTLLAKVVLHMGKKRHITLANLVKEYGPIMSLRLGAQTMIVGSSPEAAREILKTHDRVLSGRFVLDAVPVNGFKSKVASLGWNECDDGWKSLRSICRSELFSGKALDSQACLRDGKAMNMVKQIRKKEGDVVNITLLGFVVILNMLSNIIMSRDLMDAEGDDAMKEETRRIIGDITELGSILNISDCVPILRGLDIQGLKKKMDQSVAKACSLWAPIVSERRGRKGSQATTKLDFLDVLIDNDFSEAEINYLLFELITAGTDTTAATVEWTMAELIRNPGSMNKLRQELAREFAQDKVNEAKLSALPYLQACVKEALRLHAPGGLLLPHRATETCEVMNYTIPKDSHLYVNLWAVSRDPKYWEEPSVYRPERFLGNAIDYRGNDFEFIPFGAGRRICPGLSMAMKHVSLIIASLIHFFNWSLPQGVDPYKLDMTGKFNVVIKKEQPLLLIPEARICSG